MRATFEVETSHRLFKAPKGDNASPGPKKWAIQVDLTVLSYCESQFCLCLASFSEFPLAEWFQNANNWLFSIAGWESAAGWEVQRSLDWNLKNPPLRNHMRSQQWQVEVQRSQSLGGDRRLSSRLDREPEDPLRSVRKKSRKVQNKKACPPFFLRDFFNRCQENATALCLVLARMRGGSSFSLLTLSPSRSTWQNNH